VNSSAAAIFRRNPSCPRSPLFPVALIGSPEQHPGVWKHQTEAATPSPTSAWSPVRPSLAHILSGVPLPPTTPW
jgi:hypothetical protein